MTEIANIDPSHTLFQSRLIRIACKYKDYLALAAVVILSFVIRYIGLKFSYPLLTHTDEGYVLSPPVQMTMNKTLDPGIPYRPDIFLIKLFFYIFNAISFIRFGDSIATTYQANELFFVYSARLVIAIIGSFLPVMAWLIGRQAKINFSLPAAIILGFYPSYVVHSHYVTPDVTITLFSLLVIYFVILYAKTGSAKFLIFGTIVAALNTAEKYPGLISFGLIPAAILYYDLTSNPKNNLRTFLRIIGKSIRYFALFVLILYLFAPTLFIEYGRTIDAVLNEARSTHLGADNLGWGGNMIFYAREYLKAGNWLIVLMIVPGIYYSIKLRDKPMVFTLYGFIYWVILSRLALHWERWALPMYTAPLLFVSYGVSALGNMNLVTPKVSKYLKTGLIAVTGLGLFVSAFSYSVRMTYKDTRVVALEYCNGNGIVEENTLYEGYSPFSPTLGPGSISQERYQANQDKTYIILSSTMYGRYYAEPERYAQQISTYEKIKSENYLMAEFLPSSNGPLTFGEELDSIWYYIRRYFGVKLPDRFTGPVIQIYRKP